MNNDSQVHSTNYSRRRKKKTFKDESLIEEPLKVFQEEALKVDPAPEVTQIQAEQKEKIEAPQKEKTTIPLTEQQEKKDTLLGRQKEEIGDSERGRSQKSLILKKKSKLRTQKKSRAYPEGILTVTKTLKIKPETANFVEQIRAIGAFNRTAEEYKGSTAEIRVFSASSIYDAIVNAVGIQLEEKLGPNWLQLIHEDVIDDKSLRDWLLDSFNHDETSTE